MKPRFVWTMPMVGLFLIGSSSIALADTSATAITDQSDAHGTGVASGASLSTTHVETAVPPSPLESAATL